MNVVGVAIGGVVDPSILNQGNLVVESSGKIFNYGENTMINLSSITNNGKIRSTGNIIIGGTITNNGTIIWDANGLSVVNDSQYGKGTFSGNSPERE